MCDATFRREAAGERTDTASGIYLRSELVSERCRIWLTGLPSAEEFAEAGGK